MCGFGLDLIFKVAIAIVVILVVLALIRTAFPNWITGITSAPYWNIIQIVIGGVVAILILLFIWRLAECAGLFGRVGMFALPALT
jgi:hypothetical protein